MQVTLYTKENCSLCDAVQEQLEILQHEFAFDLVLRDITQDAATFERLHHQIPVVDVDGQRTLRAPITPSELFAALREAAPTDE